MKVKYSKRGAYFSIGLIAAVVVLAIVSALTMPGNFFPFPKNFIWLAPLLLALAIPQLFANYMVVSQRELVINNQFGMPEKRYSISGPGDLKFEGNKLFVEKDGKRTKVKFSSRKADKKTLDELKAKLASDHGVLV